VPSPFVRLTDFDSWEQMFRAATPRPGVNSPRRIREKMNRARREFGSIELRTGDTDVDAFEQVMRWKSEQYSRTWQSHRMTIPRNLEFYRELWRRGFFTFTSLRFGGRLVGGKIGGFGSGRSLWRITVYDPELAVHSPGSIIEMESVRAEFEAGNTESDYLMGDEAYKFTFATHIRWIGNVGKEPQLDRMLRRGRMMLARRVTRAPALYKLAKRAEALATQARGGLRRR
jgi:CelD/BcsL family acetyltransferase involved in cellulose biosynthesis